MKIVLLFVSVILFSFGNAFAGENTSTCNENLAVAKRACTADLYFANFSTCMVDAKKTWNICKIGDTQTPEGNQNESPRDVRG